MKWCNRLNIPLCVLGGVLPSCLFAAVTTVETGTKLVVTDETAGSYADGIAFADATGEVEFATSQPPQMTLTGAGAVIKTYDGPWTFTTPMCGAFTGTFVLRGSGVIAVPGLTGGYLGAWDKGTVEVCDGAAIDFTEADKGGTSWMNLKVAGSGPDGKGALILRVTRSGRYNACLRNMTLTSDTLIALDGLSAVDCHLGVGDSYSPNLNGHRLFIKGWGSMKILESTLKGDGDVILSGLEDGKPATFTFEDAAAEAGKAGDFALAGNAQLGLAQATVQTTPVALDRAIKVSGLGNSLAFEVAADTPWQDAFATTNGVAFRGPITFTNETGVGELTICDQDANAPNALLTVAGPISGPGSVRVRTSDHAVALTGENTFTGDFELVSRRDGGTTGGRTLLWGPRVVPPKAATSASYGSVWLRLDAADETAWDVASVVKLITGTAWSNEAYAVLDAAGAEASLDLAGVDLSAVEDLGANGTVRLVNLADGKVPAHFRVRAGTLALVGPAKVEADDFRIDNGLVPGIGDPATLVLDGGIDIAFGAKPFLVGNGLKDQPYAKTARLIVKNAAVHSAPTDDGTVTKETAYASALAVGLGPAEDWKDNQSGILDVRDGAVISNRLFVGGVQNHGQSRGLVIQRGGSVKTFGHGTPLYQCGVGSYGQGHYEMLGGTFEATQAFNIGNYGTGSWRQRGGLATFRDFRLGIGAGNGGRGWLDIQGGVFQVTGGLLAVNTEYSVSDVSSHVVVRGPGALLDVADGISFNGGSEKAQRSAFVVKDGATVRASFVRQANGNRLYLAFDGGTLDVVGSWRDIFDVVNNGVPTITPDHILVRAGGLTVKTSDRSLRVRSPLRAPWGGGVTGLVGFEPYNSVVPPMVVIDGDGAGAVALATFDYETGAVTGVEIVEPGVGYTTATATVGDKSYDCTVSDAVNAQSGGLTKTGTGELLLFGTNTWKGATSVLGGTLMAQCDWAIPTNSMVMLANGATLNLGGKVAKISGITYGPGLGTIVNDGNAEIGAARVVEISVDDILAGKAVEFTSAVDLSAYTLRVTGDLSKLDPAVARKHPLIKSTGGLTGNLAAVEMGALPKGWALRVTAARVSLAYAQGMLMLVK